MKNNKGAILVTAVVACLLVGAAGMVFLQQRKNNELKVSDDMVERAEALSEGAIDYNTVTYEGETYKFNTDLKTILFLGIDQRDPVTVGGYEGTGGRSDAMILLILNTKDKTTTQLEISRDTMTDVDVYSVDGEYISTNTVQITMQHAFGDGEKKSSWLSKNAVSRLLYGIPIQHTISLNMDGIGAVTDALGGVTLTVPEDYTMINDAFIKGEQVTLDGKMAEQYVRWRDINVAGSNNQRMERQSQFIVALVEKVKSGLGGNPLVYDELMKSAEPYMVTDIDAESLKELSDYKLLPEKYKLPGENKSGDLHDEYIVDNKLLYDMIIEIFYEKKEE